jgi:hypothetical protein
VQHAVLTVLEATTANIMWCVDRTSEPRPFRGVYRRCSAWLHERCQCIVSTCLDGMPPTEVWGVWDRPLRRMTAVSVLIWAHPSLAAGSSRPGSTKSRVTRVAHSVGCQWMYNRPECLQVVVARIIRSRSGSSRPHGTRQPRRAKAAPSDSPSDTFDSEGPALK